MKHYMKSPTEYQPNSWANPVNHPEFFPPDERSYARESPCRLLDNLEPLFYKNRDEKGDIL